MTLFLKAAIYRALLKLGIILNLKTHAHSEYLIPWDYAARLKFTVELVMLPIFSFPSVWFPTPFLSLFCLIRGVKE